MKCLKIFKFAVVSVSATLVITACGSDSGIAPTAAVLPNLANYAANLVSPQLQNSALFQDTFSANFLDDGYTKAKLIANIKADSAAVASGSVASDTIFPEISAKNLSISDCNAATNICSLNTTYTTAGPDTTSVTTKLAVLVLNGNFTILGNGSNVEPS